jgi:hypothetical protein
LIVHSIHLKNDELRTKASPKDKRDYSINRRKRCLAVGREREEKLGPTSERKCAAVFAI